MITISALSIAEALIQYQLKNNNFIILCPLALIIFLNAHWLLQKL